MGGVTALSADETSLLKGHKLATLVIDRFHVVMTVNQAVDEVRKAVKGLRWLLSMHSRNRTKGHTRRHNSLHNSSRRTHCAWVL